MESKLKKKTKEVILNHERTWIVDERNWDSLLLQELISFLKVSIAHYWEFLLSFRMLIISGSLDEESLELVGY